MNRPVRVGLVGCGSVSQRGLLPHMDLPDAQAKIDLAAVCDTGEERVRKTARRYNVPQWFTDAKELIAHADVEAVLIATPIPSHYGIAMRAAQAGKHIYIQKTMTTTLAEANRLVEAAEQRKIKLVASPGQMLSPYSVALKEQIQAGRLGKIYWAFATTASRGHEYEPFRGTTPVDPTWYYKAGGGPVYDMSVYVLHTLTGILGPVRRVSAMSGIGLPVRNWNQHEIRVEMDDNTLLLLDFGENCFGVAGGQFCFPGQIMSWGFMGIFGSQGAIEVPQLAPGTGYPAQVLTNPPSLANDLPSVLTDPPFPSSITTAHAAIPESHVWADVCHLVDCIQNNAQPIADGPHARHVIEIIEKGYAAARSGQTLPLESDLVHAKSQPSI